MKMYIWLILILLIFLVFALPASAQPGMPMAPNQAPIDGGLGILAVAGGSYALNKLRKRKSDNDNEEELL